MRLTVWLMLAVASFLAAGPAPAAVLRKKSGRAIIMGFSRIELQQNAVGQYITIENFEKNQWVGLIRKIYRANRVRITLLDDDSEEMEVGETFRIKKSEAPRTVGSRSDANQDEASDTLDDPPFLPASAAPSAWERSLNQDGVDQDRLLLTLGFTSRYYRVPEDTAEGDLRGTGYQLQGTFLIFNRLGLSLGLRQEKLEYGGVDRFADYNVSVLSYFSGVSYRYRYRHLSASAGLRFLLQAKGEGTVNTTSVDADQLPVRTNIRGIGRLRENSLVLGLSYDWEYASVFLELSSSFAANYSSNYRFLTESGNASGGSSVSESVTDTSFDMQVNAFALGVGLSL